MGASRRSRGTNGGGNGSRRVVRLAAILPGAKFLSCDDVPVRRCVDDAAAVRPGDVYVARMMPTGDGHDRVSDALARGAVAVVAERLIPTDGRPLCLVRHADEAWARLHQALAGEPSRELRVILVTGTSGKTTTAWLTAAALTEAGHRVGVLTDLGCLGPDDTIPEAADIAAPPVLAAWLGRCAAAGCSHVIVEVSSRMLAARATAGLVSDTVVVTTVAAARRTRRGGAAGHRRMLARSVGTLRAEGCLVSGASASGTRRLAAAAPAGISCLSAGLAGSCHVRAEPIEGSLHGRTFLLVAGGQLVPVSVDTPTVSFVRDAVLAAAVAMRYGMSLDVAARGIAAAGGVTGRVERIDRGQAAAVFVDAPTSMHAAASTLASLRRLTTGRLVVAADGDVAARLGGRRFVADVARWSDQTLVVPPTIAADDPSGADLAAYARLDRMLEALGPDDCCLVLGGLPLPDGPPGGVLGMLVDGWLQLAHPPAQPFAGRRAA